MNITATERPKADEYRDYYGTYIDKVPDGDLLQILETQIDELHRVFDPLTESQTSVVHSPWQWTLKQVIGHMIDCERVFGNRIHRFASGDTQCVPGMDQNLYVDNSDYRTPDMSSLVREMECCRHANVLMLRRISSDAWSYRAEADGHPVSVRALAWILAGHAIHHLEIAEQRIRNG